MEGGVSNVLIFTAIPRCIRMLLHLTLVRLRAEGSNPDATGTSLHLHILSNTVDQCENDRLTNLQESALKISSTYRNIDGIVV